MIPFWLGDYYEQKMENTQDEDKISQWRNARLLYRQAQIAPWMWLPIEKRKRNIDNHLSQSMYEIILIGESGAFDATQHLDFIQSREDTSSWKRVQLKHYIAMVIATILSIIMRMKKIHHNLKKSNN